jgi:uncharacterized protein (UPF0548 family)
VRDGLLAGSRLQQLRGADLTYGDRARTRGELPAGYHHLRRHAALGSGRPRFEHTADLLLHWSMHRRSGIRVCPSSWSVAEDVVAVLGLGHGVVAVEAPVRVVYVVDEPHRQGFAYGTLPGHPESGEESFLVELLDDDTVGFTITGFSRPSWWIARVAAPITRAAQSLVTHRYVRSLRD